MAEDSEVSLIQLEESAEQREAWLTLPRRIVRAFLLFDALFLVLYIVAVWGLHLQHSRTFLFFNLDAEANPSAWYSGIQLFLIAIVFLVLWSRLVPERRRVTGLRPLWLLLGLGFIYLSMDEVGQVHEQLSYIGYLVHFNARLFNHALFGDRWEWLYLVVGIVILIAYRKQLLRAWREWRSESIWFALGFALLFFGTFIMEAVHIRFHRRFFFGWREYAEIALEEGIEMVGATILMLPVFRVLSYAMTSRPDPQGSTPDEL